MRIFPCENSRFDQSQLIKLCDQIQAITILWNMFYINDIIYVLYTIISYHIISIVSYLS